MAALVRLEGAGLGEPLKQKLMSFNNGQELGQFADCWLLIGCSLLCRQSGVSLFVDPTLDNEYNS